MAVHAGGGTPGQRAGARASDRVNEIDLLRFIAALSVVFFHYAFRGHAADGLSSMPVPLLAPMAKYGYLGVELFFMISGFVILMTAAHGDLRRFVVSRIVRLYPAFWACCAITVAVTLAIGAPVFRVELRQVLVNLTMLGEFVNVEDVDGAYWSLFVEMRFYAGVALLLVFGQIRHVQRWLWVWLASSALLFVVPIPRLRLWLVADYAPLFVAGAVGYLVWRDGVSRARLALFGAAWVAALANAMRDAAVVSGRYGEPISAPVVAALVSGFFVLMLLVALRRTGFVGRRNWVTVGALTYPLYLVHQNVGYMLFNAGYPAFGPAVLLPLAVGLMLVLAWGVHLGVERPLAPVLKRALERVLRRRTPARAPV